MIDAFQRYGDYGSFLAGAPWTDKVRIVNGTRSRLNRLQAARMEFCSSLVLCHYSHVGPGSRTFGLECGTVISFWTPAADADTEEPPKLYGSAPNRWSSVVPAPSDHLGAERELPQGLHGNRHIDDVTFPVDLVCFWVDGSDPAWNERKRQRLSGGLPDTSGAAISMEANEERLYRSRDELRYALRSVEMYAPFLRHVYLVTDRQVPDWLDPAAPGLTVIDHSEIFPTALYRSSIRTPSTHGFTTSTDFPSIFLSAMMTSCSSVRSRPPTSSVRAVRLVSSCPPPESRSAKPPTASPQSIQLPRTIDV